MPIILQKKREVRAGGAPKILETEETREVRAGEARKILEAEEIADKVGEVVEKLKKPSSN